MAQGIQIWNASGDIIIDTTSRVGKVLGYTNITAGVAGSVTDIQFGLGTPFWQLMSEGTTFSAQAVITYEPSLTRLSWSSSAVDNAKLLYGVI